MTPQDIAYIKYRIEKAKETLEFDHRMRGDYEDLLTFEEDDVKDWIGRAEEFVRVVIAFVEKRLQDLPSE
jgi:uncharacterized protein (UPF0332 family)